MLCVSFRVLVGFFMQKQVLLGFIRFKVYLLGFNDALYGFGEV